MNSDTAILVFFFMVGSGFGAMITSAAEGRSHQKDLASFFKCVDDTDNVKACGSAVFAGDLDASTFNDLWDS